MKETDERLQPEKIFKDLTRAYAPLSTFSGKIKLAYAYGLILGEDYHALEAMREIRNEAAHARFQYHLDDEGLKPYLEALLEHKKVKSLFASTPNLWQPAPSRNRAIVISAIVGLHETLKNRLLELSVPKK